MSSLHQSPESVQARPVDLPRVLYVRDSHAEPGHVLAIVEVPGGYCGIGCACGMRQAPASSLHFAALRAADGCHGPHDRVFEAAAVAALIVGIAGIEAFYAARRAVRRWRVRQVIQSARTGR